MKAIWTGSPEVADRWDLACPWWNDFRAGRIAYDSALQPRHSNNPLQRSSPRRNSMAADASWANILVMRNPDGSLDTFRPEETVALLADEQIDAIRPFAEELEIPADQVVFREGQTELDFLVVLRGGIEFSATDSFGKKNVPIVRLPERSFTGDLSFFTNTPLVGDGRTTGATRILRVRHSDFRRLLSAEPDLAAVILRAFVLRQGFKFRHGVGAVVLIGKASDPDILKLRTFLSRSDYPHNLIEPDAKDENGKPRFESFGIGIADLPIAFIQGKRVLRKPSVFELASELGFLETLPSEHVYDLAIVGAGPAGLAAAVYGASEGLDTIAFDTFVPGGQAGSSSRIENYLGFPTGVSGQELANRSIAQAQKFGAQIMVAQSVVHIDTSRHPYKIVLESGLKFNARAVVIATGAQYARLPIEDADAFTGRGIYYNATHMEAQLCDSEEVAVVGGGNSAGQAAVFLAQTSSKGHLLVRSGKLSES